MAPPYTQNDSEARYPTDSSLKAPATGDISVSQPQSRTQSWKNMKRPRSFREIPQGSWSLLLSNILINQLNLEKSPKVCGTYY